jgi:hypothetical protein
MAMEKVVENLQNFALGILPQIVQKRQIQANLRAYQSSLSLSLYPPYIGDRTTLEYIQNHNKEKEEQCQSHTENGEIPVPEEKNT